MEKQVGVEEAEKIFRAITVREFICVDPKNPLAKEIR